VFKLRWLLLLALVPLVLSAACASQPSTKLTLRVGYFPNITHSQALIGIANGAFQKALGENVQIDPKLFNAGPSAIEALFANEIDLTYIGPNPAINGYVRSKGEALRIVAGATSGGAVLVVRRDANIKSASDLAGKRIATPELGNTQDVAARYYVQANNLQLREKGGTVQILPTKNPDILTLFLKKEIDAAWVPEPWGARLVQEAGGVILLDERTLWPDGKFVTAHVIVGKKFLDAHPEIVKKWLAAHVELTQWIKDQPDEAKKIANSEIKRLTGSALSAQVLDAAWQRLEVTYDPLSSSLFLSADRAFQLGFLGKDKPDLSGIHDLTLLNQVLVEKRLEAVR
jgi:NitT/TauT family transport system substrate-binding protein